MANRMNDRHVRIPRWGGGEASRDQGVGVGGHNEELGIRKVLDSTAALKVRRPWRNAFKIPRKHYSQPKITYPTKPSIKYDDKIRTFLDMHGLKNMYLPCTSGIH